MSADVSGPARAAVAEAVGEGAVSGAVDEALEALEQSTTRKEMRGALVAHGFAFDEADVISREVYADARVVPTCPACGVELPDRYQGTGNCPRLGCNQGADR